MLRVSQHTSRPLVLLGLALAAVACQPSPPADHSAEPTAELMASTHQGIAHLENKEADQALRRFVRATELAPDRALVWRNRARAELLARDSAAARRSLAEAAANETASAATSYLSGLIAARESSFEEAVDHLEAAARLDPTAATFFQLGNAYQALGRHELARERLADTLRLDPRHATAHYRLGLYAQQLGDADAFAHHQAEFQRLRAISDDQSRTAEALEASKHKRPEAFPASTHPHTDALPVPRWSDHTPAAWHETLDTPVVGLATLAADATMSRVVLLGADGSAFRLTADAAGMTLDRLPTRLPASGDEASAASLAVAVGDFFDSTPTDRTFDPLLDGLPDVAIAHPDGIRLWRGVADGGMVDVTTAAGLDTARGDQVLWLDAEADGDLDLVITTSTGPELWQNAGDGSFSNIDRARWLTTELDAPIHHLVAVDLEDDVALDMVGASPNGLVVLANQRLGEFTPRPGVDATSVRRLAIDHLDTDGRPDSVWLGAEGLFVHHADGVVRQLANADATAGLDAVDLVDLDLDGWLDVVASGDGLHAWRNLGSNGFDDVTAAVGFEDLDLGRIHALVAIHLDPTATGDLDWLLATERGLRLLRAEPTSPSRRALRIRLVGTKTNPLGLGTRIEVRTGRHHITRQVQALPITIGLGTEPEALDAVRVVWTNGIVDNTIDVPPDTAAAGLTVVEKNVAAGSCPFLYAWDGHGYRFVTDILGNSPLGLSLRRGVPLDADPDELVRIGSSEALRPEDGHFRLRVTEEMREVLYLDTARLVAVDHPADIEVHPTDRLMPAPFPPSELWGLANTRPPTAVVSSDGVDRLDAVTAIDGQFAPPGPLLPPPLRGVTQRLETTLSFADLDPRRPLVLMLTGWLQYGDASTNIAVSQGAASAPPPWLEAETPRGWQRLDVTVGLPAGKTKTIVIDLAGHLPADVQRLRLITHAEVRWDRIALGERRRGALTRHTLEPKSADLQWRGFSDIRARAEGHPSTPAHDLVVDRPPWRGALEGWVTAYGNTLESTRERDGLLTLVAAGDALDLTFDATTLPPRPDHLQRTYFFYAVGWDKDGDPNVIAGDTVAPLPTVAADPKQQIAQDTRWVPRDRFADRP